MLRQKPNEELFRLYRDELKLRLYPEQLKEYCRLLWHFEDYLGELPPTPSLATSFLAQFSNRSRRTLARYLSIIKGLMTWLGEDLAVKVSTPRQLPQYVEPNDVDLLIDTIRHKKTHKATILRDTLLIDMARFSGLRRAELANMRVKDVLLKERQVIVRGGKNQKDRAVPLPNGLVARLEAYLQDKNPEETVFGLRKEAISNKIRYFAKKSGVPLHTHSLRHHYAEALLEAEAPLPVVQALLGHSRLDTTGVYIGLRTNSLRQAVDRLETPKVIKPKKHKYHPLEEQITVGAIYRGIVPFVFVEVIFLVILTAFPQIALWLPSMM